MCRDPNLDSLYGLVFLPLRHRFSPNISELKNQLILAHKVDLGVGLKMSVLGFTRGHICGRKTGQEEGMPCMLLYPQEPSRASVKQVPYGN